MAQPTREAVSAASAPASRAAGFWWALATLTTLWLALASLTWAHWGSPTIDCGREMYVASALVEGKTLYKDIWYLYGPGAPYLNSFLFGLFGIHVDVLYMAGIVCVMLYALPLFWLSFRLSSLPAAFCVALAIILQSFHPGIFNFPLPYSYASVYGAVCASFFLLFAVGAVFHKRQAYVFGAGISASFALLMKLEFGSACYATLGVLVLGRYLHERSLRLLVRDLLSLLPGVLTSALAIFWMLSLGGGDFLTQENFMSWPTSYFMRTYGERWLAVTGFDLSAGTLLRGGLLVALFIGFWAAVGRAIGHLFAHPERRRKHLLAVGGLALGVVVLGAYDHQMLASVTRRAFLPLGVVATVAGGIPLAAWSYWRHRSCPRRLAVLIVFVFAVSLAFRHLFSLSVRSYSIYYNGPVYLAFFILLMLLALPDYQAWPSAWRRWSTLLLFTPVCALIVLIGLSPYWRGERERTPLHTERGTMYMSPGTAAAYREAIAFMRDAHRRGESVMSIPEDTSLYFFSGVPCPTRVFAFTPGVLAPGRMTDQVVEKMETLPVRYLLISNRRFPQYGAPEFGVDFDQALGEYIRERYRPVRNFAPEALTDSTDSWKLSLWERTL